MTTVRVYRVETTTAVVATNKVRVYRLETTVTGLSNSVRIYRLEMIGLGSATPGPNITNLEAWMTVKMTASATGTPTAYVWDQVAGPPVTLTYSGPLNINCTYTTPGLLSDAVLVFRVQAQYGTSFGGEGTTTHEVLHAPIRAVMADGSFVPVRVTPVL